MRILGASILAGKLNRSYTDNEREPNKYLLHVILERLWYFQLYENFHF